MNEIQTEEVSRTFGARLARNGQSTIPKRVRDMFGIEIGDTVYLTVEKVISPNGEERQCIPKIEVGENE